jgi:O-antigen ligase
MGLLKERTTLGIRSRWVAVLPGLTAGAVIGAVGADSGGFFPLTVRLSLLAVTALALAAFVTRGKTALTRVEWGFAAALGGIAVWSAVSAAWSGDASRSLLEAERTALYVAAVLAVMFVSERETVPQLLTGVLGAVTALSAYGLARYLVSPTIAPLQGRLLFKPLGYANALGIFTAMGILVAIGLASWAKGGRTRLLALLPLTILLPALYLTSSRGAWVALAAGLVAMAWFTRRIRSPVALVAVLAASVALGILLGSTGGQTLSLVGQNRPNYWAVAWQDYEAHPLLGSGAGSYGAYWFAHRPTGEIVQDAHSLYIETLAELGPIGLLLLGAAMAMPLVGLRRRGDPLAAAASGAYVAFLAHAAVDWDWEVPAVTLVGVCSGAAILVATRRQRYGPREPGGRRPGVLRL